MFVKSIKRVTADWLALVSLWSATEPTLGVTETPRHKRDAQSRLSQPLARHAAVPARVRARLYLHLDPALTLPCMHAWLVVNGMCPSRRTGRWAHLCSMETLR